MGVLEHASTGVRYPLASRMLVGRSHSCQLRLSSQQVSGVHAELAWDGERWIVHDLGSRNGTHLDGQRLSPDQRAPLAQGSLVVFGTGDEHFVLVDGAPPGLVAIADDGRLAHAIDGLLSLPSEDEPELTVIEQRDGRWRLETTDAQRSLSDQEPVMAGGTRWLVHLPGAVQRTADGGEEPMAVSNVELEFQVSRDQEHVKMRVHHQGRSIGLRPRAHDFFLLTLARARIDDQRQPGLPSAEHGWVYRQDLERRLQIDRNLLNLWIYRARRQFTDAGVADVGDLVERRLDAEQLRMGVSRLRVVHVLS
ncbi:FHA domain-containing protein [Paraliomyxa miuraensis]|uniref:FHA domain-containing protein n=1 Tax=Paraliomyxa miuraensis TaxID=376150 RepID=UPI0022568FF2|nr:FHA domain-containing protein [Paraliomyxa miuraensis]MCX4246615.1 FHA domain-containing protein [Paraliomyxa miuraensis]